MKSNRVLTFTLAAIAGLILAAQSGLAQPGGGGGGFGGGGGGGRGGRGLGPDATPEQTAAYTEFTTATTDLVAKVTAARTELNTAIFAEKVDDAAIKAKAGALAKAEEELALARAKAFAKVRSKFTPEQIETIKTQTGRGGAGGGRRGAGG